MTTERPVPWFLRCIGIVGILVSLGGCCVAMNGCCYESPIDPLWNGWGLPIRIYPFQQLLENLGGQVAGWASAILFFLSLAVLGIDGFLRQISAVLPKDERPEPQVAEPRPEKSTPPVEPPQARVADLRKKPQDGYVPDSW